MKKSEVSLSKQQEIQSLLSQKVVDLNSIIQQRGILENFFQLVNNSIVNLTKNMLGDYSYQRKNKFSLNHKLKIIKYLKEKSMMLFNKQKESNQKKFYQYDPNCFNKKTQNLHRIKEMLLHGKSQLEAAQDNLERFKNSRDYIRAQFLNEAAYQFDRQRYCSIYWGALTGCLINSTIYRKGRTARKAALIAILAHIFGQVSYHLNLDKYFDSVYAIYQEEAQAYMREEEMRTQIADKKLFIKNTIEG